MPQFNYYHRSLPYQRIWPKSGQIWPKSGPIWQKSGSIWQKSWPIWPKSWPIWPKSGPIFNDEGIGAWEWIYGENVLRPLWKIISHCIPVPFHFILFSPTQDAPNSQTPVKGQFIGLYLNGKPKGVKFHILKFNYQLTKAQRNGARSPRFCYHTTWSSDAFLLCPRKDVLSPSSQRYQDTKGKHEDKCFSIPLP